MSAVKLGESETRISVEVSRPIFTENVFQKDFEQQEDEDDQQKKSFRQRIEKNCTPKSLLSMVLSVIPIISWLPKYKIKEYIVGDIIGGITVGISRIPIAMAYALLASLPAVYGLYNAFFPVLIYTFLGTSRHIAIGCEAVTAIMIAGVLDNVVDQMEIEPIREEEVRTGAASSLLLLVAIVQLGMFIFRLGIITTYFSEPLVRGFTNGACCHIFTSQFRELFGVTIPKLKGDYFQLPKAYIELFSRLGQCNTATLLIALIAMVAMVIGSELLDYELYRGSCRKKVDGKPKQRMIIPTDLIVVIVALLASTFGEFADKYGVAVIGDLPVGIPPPQMPPKEYFEILLPDIFAIAIVGFAISYSAGKVYAKKFDYETDANQELMAYGSAGLVSSFFNCYPFSTSMGRSGIQEGAGAKTQIASLLSCGVILLTLFLIAPLLSQLPKCALAVMIILAMRGIFRQFADLPKLWKLSLIDFLIWVVTWVTVILLGVHIGLYIGIVFSLVSVIVRNQRPKTSLMGRVEGTDIYREEKGIKTAAEELPGVRIFRFSASLCFFNTDFFKKSLYARCGVNPRMKASKENQDENLNEKRETDIAESDTGKRSGSVPVHTIIIDCGMMAFIDVDGMQTLQTIAVECQHLHVNVLFANVNARIQNTLLNSDIINSMYQIQLDQIFVTLHDAVEHALSANNQKDALNQHGKKVKKVTDDTLGNDLTSANRSHGSTSKEQPPQEASIQAGDGHLDDDIDNDDEDGSIQKTYFQEEDTAHSNEAFHDEAEDQEQSVKNDDDTQF